MRGKSGGKVKNKSDYESLILKMLIDGQKFDRETNLFLGTMTNASCICGLSVFF